ncbi:MAG: PAS domain-containing protein, partial [Planctomycetes bacterium]|nr:PAS domain-containing protein [Planctomycetota bacterium]
MGLGSLRVHSVLILPVVERDQTLAVLEVGSMEAFDDQTMAFFEALRPVVAVKLQILLGNVATRELLEKTQAQAQTLAASELQLRARRDQLESLNEQLSGQAQSLEEQAEELERQKETLLQQRTVLETSKAALAQTEEHTRLVLTSVSDGIMGLDTESRTTFVNAAAMTMLGYSEEELLASPIHPLVHHSRQDGTAYPLDDCPMHQTTLDGVSRKV